MIFTIPSEARDKPIRNSERLNFDNVTPKKKLSVSLGVKESNAGIPDTKFINLVFRVKKLLIPNAVRISD